MTTTSEQWRPMKTAPKDGTIVRLLVDYSGEDACHPLEDATITHTIGGCTDGNTGLREGWKFAGWSWEQDCFCEGRGKAIGWLPFDAPAAGVSGMREVPVTLEQVEQLAKTMWKGEPVPGRVLRFGAAVLGLADAAGVPEVDTSKPHWRCVCGTVAMPLTDETRCKCADTYGPLWTHVVPSVPAGVGGTDA